MAASPGQNSLWDRSPGWARFLMLLIGALWFGVPAALVLIIGFGG